MKKDTHGVFTCITPNWNFPLKNIAPSSSAVRRKPPHLGGTTENRRKTNSKSLAYFLDLEPCFTEILFRAVFYKLKKRQKNYWSSSYICICMSCSPRFHPDIIILHMEKPALNEIGAPSLEKLAAPWHGRSLCPVRKFSDTRGVLQELLKLKGREERPSFTEKWWIKALLQEQHGLTELEEMLGGQSRPKN